MTETKISPKIFPDIPKGYMSAVLKPVILEGKDTFERLSEELHDSLQAARAAVDKSRRNSEQEGLIHRVELLEPVMEALRASDADLKRKREAEEEARRAENEKRMKKEAEANKANKEGTQT